MPTADIPHAERIAAVRRFNRFYTRSIGLIGGSYLNVGLSLPEGRVLYELGSRKRTVASELVRDLGLDAGYLSRILASFEKRGLMRKTPSADDRRSHVLELTAAGKKAFATIDERSSTEVGALIAPLDGPAQTRLVGAMGAIENLLGANAASGEPYVLRAHRPGDIGWVIERHGAIYAHEYGWDERFEALVAEVAAQFIRTFDPARERCWIAERDGMRAGCVFLVKQSDEVAKLRLLIVEPSGRGQGLGRRLVDECIRFAGKAGYRKLTLWTQRNLTAARRIYKAAGFRRVHSEPYHDIGKPLVSETWDLGLAICSGRPASLPKDARRE